MARETESLLSTSKILLNVFGSDFAVSKSSSLTLFPCIKQKRVLGITDYNREYKDQTMSANHQ